MPSVDLDDAAAKLPAWELSFKFGGVVYQTRRITPANDALKHLSTPTTSGLGFSLGGALLGGFNLATGNFSGLAADATSFAGVIGRLGPAMKEATYEMMQIVDRVTSSWREAAVPHSNVLGPPAPASPGAAHGGVGNTTINANVTTMIDARDTANMIVNRIWGPLKAEIDRDRNALAGAAQQAVIEKTMGGG